MLLEIDIACCLELLDTEDNGEDTDFKSGGDVA
jgi:hypothetical protein